MNVSLTSRLIPLAEVMIDLSRDSAIEPKTIDRLNREHGQELATLVIASAALQTKARSKLGEGDWWVTEKSVQQATPWQVARLKAGWFAQRPVIDLCCGIAGDTIELARRGSVIGVDLDEVVAEMAAANLQSIATSHSVEVRCEDVRDTRLSSETAIHIDPDRRSDGKRTTDPDQYQPAREDVTKMVRTVDSAIIKLAPAARVDLAELPEARRVWISLAGSVREQSIVVGEAIEQAGLGSVTRAAYRVRRDSTWKRFAATEEESTAIPIDVYGRLKQRLQPGDWLIDPDASIRAAGLTIAFANRSSLKLMGKPSGFLSSAGSETLEEAVSDLAVVGRVVWVGTADDRKLRREFRRRNVYPITIKVRGSDHDPSSLARRYRSCGEQPVTLWIGRAGDKVYAAITEPLSQRSLSTAESPLPDPAI